MSEKKYTDNLKHEYLLSKLKLFEAIVKAARKRAPKKLYIHLKKKKEQIQLKRRMNYEKCSKDKGFGGGGRVI